MLDRIICLETNYAYGCSLIKKYQRVKTLTKVKALTVPGGGVRAFLNYDFFEM